MLESIVDRIIVITVPGAEERQRQIAQQLAQLNLPFEFEYAVSLVPEEMVENPYLGWTNGAKSLKLTTIGIIEKAKKNKLKRIMVLEDDSFFDFDNFSRISSDIRGFIEKVQDNFHFLHTFYSFVPGLNFTPFQGILKLNKGALGCQSYIINHTVFDEYLERLKSNEKPIDHITRDIHIQKKMSYCTALMLTKHIPGKYSYIRKKKVSY